MIRATLLPIRSPCSVSISNTFFQIPETSQSPPERPTNIKIMTSIPIRRGIKNGFFLQSFDQTNSGYLKSKKGKKVEMAPGRSGMPVCAWNSETGSQSGFGHCMQGNWITASEHTLIHIAWLPFHDSGRCVNRISHHGAWDPTGNGLPAAIKYQGLKMPIYRNGSIFAACGSQGRIQNILPICFDRRSAGLKMALSVIFVIWLEVHYCWSSTPAELQLVSEQPYLRRKESGWCMFRQICSIHPILRIAHKFLSSFHLCQTNEHCWPQCRWY